MDFEYQNKKTEHVTMGISDCTDSCGILGRSNWSLV